MSSKSIRYINRELSWLEFNQRVLDEARNPETPLLERLKFLAITSSNLDEFFMVRVGGLQLLSLEGNVRPDPSGMTPDEQLTAISARTHQMIADQYTCFLREIEPLLVESEIVRVYEETLTENQHLYLEKIFSEELFPIYTPMAVTGQEDFPLLSNQTLNLCVQLKPSLDDEENRPRFAIIPLGQITARFITLPSQGGYAYILLEDVIRLFVQQFFPGEDIVECVPFRISRNADMSLQEDQAADLLAEMAEVLDARKQSNCVRLEISDKVTSRLLKFLKETLEVNDQTIYVCPGPIDLSFWMSFSGLSGYDALKYEAWPPRPSPRIDRTIPMFDTISQAPVLLYHPYDSFEPVIRMIDEAADDPDVLAIKQTLYRTSRNSPIVNALLRAAENGKHVTALVEVKARFDEARNIEWANTLEQKGVQVIYGVKGLKTHSKICMIVRREAHGIQRYMHFGTGNYNESTARLYSDVSYMTNDEELAADATSFFNAITGYSQPQSFRKLEMAPLRLREKLLELIEGETERKRQGQKAEIMVKMNSLVDPDLIEALYRASEEGVKIRLNIRGICCLKPGSAKHNKNITVISIIDRFLEHARIFYFRHGGDDLTYISSADWMPRNLDRRIELLVPIEDDRAKKRLIDILKIHFKDKAKGRKLTPTGNYEATVSNSKSPLRSQAYLYQLVTDELKKARESQTMIFEPHLPPNENS